MAATVAPRLCRRGAAVAAYLFLIYSLSGIDFATKISDDEKT